MSLLVPRRRPTRERLDDPRLPADEMRRSLEDIALVHRFWGGLRSLERHLALRLRALGRPACLLDVGAGSGFVARRLSKELASRGCPVRVFALDLQWRHLAAGRPSGDRNGSPAVAADAFRLPYGDGAVDFVVSTLLFHHFSPAENRRLLSEFRRVARYGYALLDLRRHVFPLLFVSLAGRALFRTSVSVEDGMASVRQAYTPEEALGVAREADPGSRVERVFPFRLLISSGP